MKTVNEIIEQALTENDMLQTNLDNYKLTLDDVGVILVDEDADTVERITESKPILVMYSITNDKIDGLAFTFDTANEDKIRKARLKKVGKGNTMQEVKDLSSRQIFDYGYLDRLITDLEIANQGGYEVTKSLTEISIDDDATVDDFKSSMLMIQRALQEYKDSISTISFKFEDYKSCIINRSNDTDNKIDYKNLELLERLKI